MKANEGDKCCVCQRQAAVREFDGTAWCGIHYEDWKAFLQWERSKYASLDAAFQAWLKVAREGEAK